MKIFICMLCGLGILAPAALAQTSIPGDPKAGYFYAGLHGGLTVMRDAEMYDDDEDDTIFLELDWGFNVGGAAGYKFKNGLRLEAEYTFRKNSANDVSWDDMRFSDMGVSTGGNIQMHAFMGNVWWEPRLGEKWLPYAGAGLGFALSDSELNTSSEYGDFVDQVEDTVFAYQLGAGIGYQVLDNWVVSVDYRYWGTSRIEVVFDEVEAEIGTHNIMAGIRAHL